MAAAASLELAALKSDIHAKTCELVAIRGRLLAALRDMYIERTAGRTSNSIESRITTMRIERVKMEADLKRLRSLHCDHSTHVEEDTGY